MGVAKRTIQRLKAELGNSFRLSHTPVGSNSSVLRTHACGQLILMLAAGMILDGGFSQGIVAFASLAYWAMVAPVFFRWSTPTRFDTWVVRYGFVTAILVITPLCAWLRSVFWR